MLIAAVLVLILLLMVMAVTFFFGNNGTESIDTAPTESTAYQHTEEAAISKEAHTETSAAPDTEPPGTEFDFHHFSPPTDAPENNQKRPTKTETPSDKTESNTEKPTENAAEDTQPTEDDSEETEPTEDHTTESETEGTSFPNPTYPNMLPFG